MKATAFPPLSVRWLVSWVRPPRTRFSYRWRLHWIADTYPRYVWRRLRRLPTEFRLGLWP